MSNNDQKNKNQNCHCDNAKPILSPKHKYATHSWSNQQFFGNIAVRSNDKCNNVYGNLTEWNRFHEESGNDQNWHINDGRIKRK